MGSSGFWRSAQHFACAESSTKLWSNWSNWSTKLRISIGHKAKVASKKMAHTLRRQRSQKPPTLCCLVHGPDMKKKMCMKDETKNIYLSIYIYIVYVNVK